MKTPRRLPWFAGVRRGLRSISQPPPTTANHRQRRQRRQTVRSASGFTLIELLAAAAIVSIATTAMVSLSATVMLQEEMATRVAITRNYQENMVRLWQLGLSPVQVAAVIPSQTQNVLLEQAIQGTPSLVETGVTTVNGTAMETALCTAVVNSSQDPYAETPGASFTLTAYRPRLISALRPPPP